VATGGHLRFTRGDLQADRAFRKRRPRWLSVCVAFRVLARGRCDRRESCKCARDRAAMLPWPSPGGVQNERFAPP
jgi:hypothetical protein